MEGVNDGAITWCTRDTDGDGDCPVCARVGNSAPCRIQVPPSAPSYEALVNLLDQVRGQEDSWQDSWGRTPSEIEAMGGYHSKPRQFMQGLGGGLPYNTNNPWHYTARYGMRAQEQRVEPGYWVGVRTSTVEAMMIEAARERSAKLALRLLYRGMCG